MCLINNYYILSSRYASVVQSKRKERNKTFQHSNLFFNDNGDITNTIHLRDSTGFRIDSSCLPGTCVMGKRLFKLDENLQWYVHVYDYMYVLVYTCTSGVIVAFTFNHTVHVHVIMLYVIIYHTHRGGAVLWSTLPTTFSLSSALSSALS